MSAPSNHTTPDGSSFRISKVQDMREQSLFLGQKFTFQVEKEAAEGDGAVDRANHRVCRWLPDQRWEIRQRPTYRCRRPGPPRPPWRHGPIIMSW